MSEAAARRRIWAKVRPWIGRLGATAEERVVALATALCVALGLWLRARGFFFDAPDFWIDECAWAIYLTEQPLVDLLIRPPGFMAVSKALASLFGPSEMVLRTLPWIAGVTGLLIAPFLAKRLFVASPSRLLFVAVIALHPSAASFAKEFKPYEVSLTLHIALAFLTLRYVASRSARDLAWLLAVAFISGPFAQDMVFAYPGVFLVAGYDALRNRRAHLLAIGACALAIIVVIVLQYVFIWSRMPPEDVAFWGNKYKVFHTTKKISYLTWLFERYQNLAAFPGYHRLYWNAHWIPERAHAILPSIALAVWAILHVVGLISLTVRRRWRVMLLVVLPVGLVWLFNFAKIWPFGVFRANLFLVAYTAAIAAAAFDYQRKRWAAMSSLVPAAVLILIPIFWFERGWGQTKRALTYPSEYSTVVRWLADQPKERGRARPLVLDRRSCEAWHYYVRIHPETKKLRRKIERAYRMQCVEDARLADVLNARLAAPERPVWVLLNIRVKTKAVITELRHKAEFTARVTAAGHTAIRLGDPPKPKEKVGVAAQVPTAAGEAL